MKKIGLIAGFSLLAVLLQLIVAPWLAIRGVKPDFVLILILFVAVLFGRVSGQLCGFGFGMIMDLIGIGSFLGLSALTKTVAGFLAGYLKGQHNRLNGFTFYTFICFIIFIHYLIFFLINYHSAEYPVQLLVFRYVLPNTLYTAVVFIIFDYILSFRQS